MLIDEFLHGAGKLNAERVTQLLHNLTDGELKEVAAEQTFRLADARADSATGLAADGLMILDGILRHRNLWLPLRPRRPEYACNSIQFVGQTGNVQLLISTHWSRITNS